MHSGPFDVYTCAKTDKNVFLFSNFCMANELTGKCNSLKSNLSKKYLYWVVRSLLFLKFIWYIPIKMAYLKHSFSVGDAKLTQTWDRAIGFGKMHFSPAAPTTDSTSLQSYFTKSILSKIQFDAISLYLSIVCLIIMLSVSS